MRINLSRSQKNKDKNKALSRGSKKETKTFSMGKAIFFALLVLTIGFTVFYFILIRPVLKEQAAKSWQTVQATITESYIKESHSDDGTTYRPYIAYRYNVNNQQYHNNRYSFFEYGSSNYKRAKRITKLYPVGSKSNIYFDPQQPSQSVINRTLSKWLYLFCLIPIVCLIAANAIINAAKKAKRRKINFPNALDWLPIYDLDSYQSRDQGIAYQAASRFNKFLGIALFTSIFCGATFFLHKVEAPLIFPIVFGFFSLILVCVSVNSFLKIFTPRPTFLLNQKFLKPGGEYEITCTLKGNHKQLKKIKLELLGQEKATYSRGTKTYTDTETFYKSTISELSRSKKTFSANFNIPENAPHSFKSEHNEILWSISLKAEIPKYPDIKENMNILVTPQGYVRNQTNTRIN